MLQKSINLDVVISGKARKYLEKAVIIYRNSGCVSVCPYINEEFDICIKGFIPSGKQLTFINGSFLRPTLEDNKDCVGTEGFSITLKQLYPNI